MPRSWICLLACSTWLLVGFQDPDDGLPPTGAPAARPKVLAPGGAGGADTASADLAGLARGERAEVLTWERVYKLAIVKAKTEPGKGALLAKALDPKRLDEDARRVGFNDFARFRREFLGGPGEGPQAFRDPAPALLESLRRAREAAAAPRHVLACERQYRELIVQFEDKTSGRTQLGLDVIDAAIQRARMEQIGKTRRYRDGLDALKIELGLAPEAPVVVDSSVLAAFGEVFDAAERWVDAPGQDFPRLDRLPKELPRLDDVAIAGRSLIGAIGQGSWQVEDLLRAAARVAVARREGRGEDADATALRVRREGRMLQESWFNYQIESRHFILQVRLVDRAREDIFAPPATVAVTERSAVSAFGDARARLVASEDRLVAGWVAYQVQRLALLRDLGALPADDWPGYFAALTARKGEPGPR